MCAYNYRQHKLKVISDVDTLETLIRQHGCFSKKDYNHFWRQATETETPSRIQSRLIRKIKPLIVLNETMNVKAEVESPQVAKPKDDKLQPDHQVSHMFSQLYNASDFTFEDGEIRLGDWKLKSKRIKKVHPSWLEHIDHKFKIASESRKLKLFHFVPYTDLSYILEAVNKQIKEQEDRKLKETFENDRVRLTYKIKEYLHNSMCRTYENDTRLDNKATNLFNLLTTYGLVDINKDEFIKSVHECNMRVPVDNLTIHDGYVEISLKGCDFINCPEWEECVDFLSDSFPRKYFHLYEQQIKDVYQSEVDDLSKQMTLFESIDINTYISAKSFEEAFLEPRKNPHWRLYINKDLADIKPTHFSFPASYLFHNRNEGFSILCTLYYDLLKSILTSEIFQFLRIPGQVRSVIPVISVHCRDLWRKVNTFFLNSHPLAVILSIYVRDGRA